MEPRNTTSATVVRTLQNGKVLQLHTADAVCISQDSRDLAELLSALHKRALVGDAEGALVVVVDKDGQWHAHIAGHLARNDHLQLSIISHLFGMAIRGPLVGRIEG